MRGLQLLRLLQVFDSQFPVGAFAHSGGLETYAQQGAGLVQLRELLANQIAYGWGRCELATACLAWQADSTAALDGICARASAMKVVPSVRDASVRLGTRTLTLLQRLHPRLLAELNPRPAHHAVVVGAAGRLLDLPLRELLLAYAANMLGGTLATATRCMPVSPAQAQLMLVELQPRLADAVERALAHPDDAMFTCTPGLDIRCDEQGRLHTRLFQS
jgi:urease accessory protein